MSKYFNPQSYPFISNSFTKGFLFTGLAFFLCLAGSVQAQTTVTLTADRDNTIFLSDPFISNGGGHLFTGNSFQASPSKRALVHFDVAGTVPAGATITNVEFTLTVNRSNNSGITNVALRRLLNDWGEAGSVGFLGQGMGAPAQANDATWFFRFFNTQLWTNPGGDFAAADSATTAVGVPGAYTWGSNAAMIADVQLWLNSPIDNFGWILIGDEINQPTAKRYASREDPLPAVRPALQITYLMPTAAGITIAGRVRTKSGRGISRSIVRLSGPDGLSRTSYTGSFGLFQFEDLPAGETYIISVTAPRYNFTDPVQFITARDNIKNFDFVAEDR